jgi:hypothetical protein
MQRSRLPPGATAQENTHDGVQRTPGPRGRRSRPAATPQGGDRSAARRLPHRRHRKGQRAERHRTPRELANDSSRPITLYINSAGGNVTDGLAIHDVVRHIVWQGIEVTIVVQGMAYSMGSVVLQAASPGGGSRFRIPGS